MGNSKFTRAGWSDLSAKLTKKSQSFIKSSQKSQESVNASFSSMIKKGKKLGNDRVDKLIQKVSSKETEERVDTQEHLTIAKESLTYLLNDKRVPDDVKESLKDDFLQVQKMLEKLEHEYIHIAVLGRVSVGKSSLLNALLVGDEDASINTFSVSPLHGETKKTAYSDWKAYQSGFVTLIDTPGINEVDGKSREKIAMEVVTRSDIILFVVDGDITHTEYEALSIVAKGVQPIILVLNKADQYTAQEKTSLLDKLKETTSAFVKPENIVLATSSESSKTVIYVDENGGERETQQTIPVDVLELKYLLLTLLEKEGKSLAALNATFFAGQLSDNVAERLIISQQKTSTQVIKMYCLSKSLAVAVNPVPVVDLMSAALIDVGMIVHLSKVYGLDMSRSESAKLIKTIMSQLILLMGAIWVLYLMSSALKVTSLGFSTVVTATGEGAVAYYGTYIVGKAANLYFKQGKSWGELGPRRAVKKILDSIDRDSIMQEAKDGIMARM